MTWNDQNGGWNMMDGGAGWVMMFVVLLLVVAVAGALVVMFRRTQAPSSTDGAAPGRSGRAGRILDERFASGEIDEDEYRRRQSVLLDD